MSLLEYESVRRWAGRIKFSKSYEYVLQDFVNWTRENNPDYGEITPDGLIML